MNSPVDKFTEVFLAYQKHVHISENAMMTAAIMRAIRALPTEEEQIKALEAKMSLRQLGAYLGAKNIDTRPIFAELEKMSSPLVQPSVLGVDSASGQSALQGPLLKLPKTRPAPESVGNNPIVSEDKNSEEVRSDVQSQQVPVPSPRRRIIMHRRPDSNQASPGGNQLSAEVGPKDDQAVVDDNQPPVGDPQTSQKKAGKPNLFSGIGDALSKIWPGKEKNKSAATSTVVKQPKAQGKSKLGGKGFIMGLGIGVFLVLIVLVFLSASLMSSQDFSPNVAEVPFDSAQTPQDNTSAPVYVPEEAEMILELTEPMLKKPGNFEDFINNFPLRWLLWIGFLLPLFNQLKQDRFAAAEKTDLISIGIGILAMLLLTVFSGAISTFASSYLVTTQMSSYPADFQSAANNTISGVIEALMVIMGVAFNLGMQLSASQSGKRDYSALAVGGFFSTGVILVWWYSGHSLIVSLGWIMMCLGMYIQAKEMSKTYQGGGAIVVSFIMIAFFFLGFVVSSFAMKYIVQLDLPEILAYAVYKSSLAVSVFFGGLISWSGGDYIATNILPPKKLAEGGDGEDSSASIAELPVTVKYDAMAFGMMIMYPLVSIWWYVSALVSTFS